MGEAFNREQVVEAARRVCGSLGPDVVDALEPFLALPQPEAGELGNQTYSRWSAEWPSTYVEVTPVVPVPQEDVTDEMRARARDAVFEAKGRELSYTEEEWLDVALVAALSREPGSSK